MKLSMIILVGILILVSATFAIKEKKTAKENYVINSESFAKKIMQPKVLLVDVRSMEEYNEGHLAGAIQIDMHEKDFAEWTVAAKEKSEKKTIALYCRSGKRSHTAAKLLISKGIKVIELDGGILKWIKDGKPIVK